MEFITKQKGRVLMDVKIKAGVTTKSYVVQGAELKCSLGMTTSKLQLPIGHGVFIRDKKQANVGDFKPLYNILPFGSCKISSPPPPCIPAITGNWLNGKEDVVIETEAALLNTSLVVCSCGGIIKITDDGQM